MAVNGVPATGSSDGDNTRIDNTLIDRAWINARMGGRDNQLHIILTQSDRIHDVLLSSSERVAELQSRLDASSIVDVAGGWVTPGLIDCHTHLVFAGHRANEFEQRLQGVSYATIARQGGGIMATVQQTRKASFEELLELSMPRVQALISQGVTTVEIKSGYGLELEAELKMLRVARELESGFRFGFVRPFWVPMRCHRNTGIMPMVISTFFVRQCCLLLLPSSWRMRLMCSVKASASRLHSAGACLRQLQAMVCR